MSKVLVVAKFDTFQHYRDRNPPWIKLHNTVLDDYAFIELSDGARSHLMLIWLLAARHGNRIPYSQRYISEALHTRGRVNIDALVAAGFVSIVEDDVEQNASAPLAERKQPASPHARPRARGEAEAEAKRETEAEAEQTLPHAAATWLTPFLDLWSKTYGGDLDPGKAARFLSALHKKHGPEALRRWGIYLAATEAKYATPASFAEKFGAYDGTPRANGPRPLSKQEVGRQNLADAMARRARERGEVEEVTDGQ